MLLDLVSGTVDGEQPTLLRGLRGSWKGGIFIYGLAFGVSCGIEVHCTKASPKVRADKRKNK
jgi:hypothetical protein